jgi:hypothetical protein
MTPRRLGELLVAEGLLSPSAVQRALGFQSAAAPRVKLGSILLTWDLIDETNLLRALSALHRCEAVTGDMLADAPVDVVRLLPAPHAIRLNAIPYALEKSRIRVAFVNPSDLGVIDEVAALTGHACVPGVVTELRLLQAHRRFYGRALPPELRPVLPRVDAARASRADGLSPAAPSPVRTVPVTAPPPKHERGESVPISIPELPIPPSPAEARRETPSPPAHQSAPASADRPETSSAAEPSGPIEATAPKGTTVRREPQPSIEPVPGVWSHAAAPPPISEQEIGDLAVATVPAAFPRVILFSCRPGALSGWRSRGVDAQGVAELQLSDALPSVLGDVRKSETPHFGRVDPERWPEALARLLDGPPPCAIFPVHSAHGVTAVLYADRRGAPMRFEDTGLLARAAAEIAALLVRESGSRIRPIS